MKTQSLDFKKERLEQAKKHAESKNGKCLSTIYVTAISHLVWYCNKHDSTWKASYNLIFCKNTWCPICAQEQKTKSFEPKLLKDYHEVAKLNNGKCLTTEYRTQKVKVLWKCHNDNHPPFEAAYRNVKYLHSWCPICSRNKSPKEGRVAQLEMIASKKSGQVLETFTEKYFSAKLKCKVDGHEPWIARVDSILKDGSWCRQCSIRNNKTENKIRIFFEKFYKAKFPNVRPKWNQGKFKFNPYLLESEKILAKKKNKIFTSYLELDGYNEELKLAFEYDGAYHFILDSREKLFSNKIRKFSITKQNDYTKEVNCKNEGIKLIRFPILHRKIYNHFFKLLRFVIEECKKYDVSMQFTLKEIRELQKEFYS